MLVHQRVFARMPMLLLYSFMLGLLLDAFAEHLGAQDAPSWRIKYTSPIRQSLDGDQEEESSELDDLETDGNDGLKPDSTISGTLDDGTELTKSLMDIQLAVIDHANSKPEDQSSQLLEINYISNYPGTFQHRLAMWCPPNIRYQPLYFEDVGLERYGYHRGDLYEPVVSAVFFAKSFTLLPLNMYRERPNSCTYPLGFCRPGSLARQIEPRWLRR